MTEENNRNYPKGNESRAGLCADCRFMRRIESARGSTFYLCQRSATDSNFPKYPRLPVIHCAGYEQNQPRVIEREDGATSGK